jgi:hypothetical protein
MNCSWFSRFLCVVAFNVMTIGCSLELPEPASAKNSNQPTSNNESSTTPATKEQTAESVSQTSPQSADVSADPAKRDTLTDITELESGATTAEPIGTPLSPRNPLPSRQAAPHRPENSSGWSLYNVSVRSCFPGYTGPSLRLANGLFDPSKFDAPRPRCTSANRGLIHCTSKPDNSPSGCQFCESNLYVCL